MQTLKIDLTDKEGKIIGFLTDREIIDNLYITFDVNKVEENYLKFHINYQNCDEKGVKTHFFKQNNTVILSIQLDSDNHVQYVIEESFNINNLVAVPDNIVPYEFKKQIAKALLLS